MEILRLLILFVHLVGLAALLGGMFVQVRSGQRAVNPAMLHGAVTMLVTGLLAVGVLEGIGAGPDNAKIAVKLVVAIAVTVLVLANRKKHSLPSGLFFGLLALTLVNAAVAVFWSPTHTA